MNFKKIIYIVLGCIGVGLGALGAVLPLLPAFPFLLLAAFCFGRSSEKLHTWFISTNLYKDNLESYVQSKGMTKKTKIRIMVMVTLLMSIGFIMMHRVPVGRIALGCVWVFHIIYFIFGIKTIPSCGYCRKMKLSGIDCKNCVRHLEKTLQSAGMTASFNCKTGIVTVYSEAKPDRTLLSRLVNDAGFGVEQVWESEVLGA